MEQDFYIDKLIVHHDIDYWDLTKLYYNDIVVPGELNKNYIKKFYTYEDLIKAIKKNKEGNTIYMIMMHFSYHTIPLFRILKQNNCITSSIISNGFPSLNYLKRCNHMKISPRDLQSRNNSLYKILKIKTQNYIAKTSKRLNLISEYPFVFLSGEFNYKRFPEIESRIMINFFDYDDYLSSLQQNENSLIDCSYCVFLDDFLIDHPDFKMKSYKLFNSADYLTELNHFFNGIEKQTNIKVIIAAHPKSKYAKNAFYDRKIITHHTRQLVKYSNFVITHMSTSLSFAILYKKPILFISSDLLKRYLSYNHLFIKQLAKYLNASYININIDVKVDMNSISVDDTRYEDYKYAFLTSKESRNRLSYHIINEHLNNLFSQR